MSLLKSGSSFLLKRNGEDPRFEGGPLIVPSKTLRDREGDVLTPGELAARHLDYYWRTVIGPSYRADVWARQSEHPEESVAHLAEATYASYATAWTVKRDWEVALG